MKENVYLKSPENIQKLANKFLDKDYIFFKNDNIEYLRLMKKNKQLNLYFDENIHQKKNNKDLDKRINVIISIFLLISLLTLSKLLMIGFEKKKFYFADNYFLENVKRRAIVDQNYNLLAYNIKTHDLIDKN